MKLLLVVVVLAAIAANSEGEPQFWRNSWDTVKKPFRFSKEAIQGTGDMAHAYFDMRRANWRGADKYFHARGNYDAAQRGPGGVWASRIISNARERMNQGSGSSPADSAADQEANIWGRNGGDPNRYRPKDLPPKW